MIYKKSYYNNTKLNNTYCRSNDIKQIL